MSFLINDGALDLLFREAQSVNRYSDYVVRDDELAEVWDVVKWGPTGLNTQPLRIIPVRSGEDKAALLTAVRDSNIGKVQSAPVNLVLAFDPDYHTYIAEQHINGAALAPGMAANPEMRLEVARNNAWLQTGFLIVGLRARGLVVGPMGGFDAEVVRRELLGGTNLVPFLILGVGKPGDDAVYPRGPRLETSTVILPPSK